MPWLSEWQCLVPLPPLPLPLVGVFVPSHFPAQSVSCHSVSCCFFLFPNLGRNILLDLEKNAPHNKASDPNWDGRKLFIRIADK